MKSDYMPPIIVSLKSNSWRNDFNGFPSFVENVLMEIMFIVLIRNIFIWNYKLILETLFGYKYKQMLYFIID